MAVQADGPIVDAKVRETIAALKTGSARHAGATCHQVIDVESLDIGSDRDYSAPELVARDEGAKVAGLSMTVLDREKLGTVGVFAEIGSADPGGRYPDKEFSLARFWYWNILDPDVALPIHQRSSHVALSGFLGSHTLNLGGRT